MKKAFLLLITLILLFSIDASAQTDSIKIKINEYTQPRLVPVKVDSITIAQINAIYNKIDNLVPRYKLYETTNMYISIKLDTATGGVWMVQYGVGDTEAMVATIDSSSLLYSFEDVKAGRFELYPTKNNYNFILLDTKYGDTYQVQWHTDIDKRMRLPIY